MLFLRKCCHACKNISANSLQNEITRQRNLDEVKKCSHAGNSEWMTAIKAEVRAGQQTILKSLFGHDHLKNIFWKAQVVSFYWYFINYC